MSFVRKPHLRFTVGRWWRNVTVDERWHIATHHSGGGDCHEGQPNNREQDETEPARVAMTTRSRLTGVGGGQIERGCSSHHTAWLSSPEQERRTRHRTRWPQASRELARRTNRGRQSYDRCQPKATAIELHRLKRWTMNDNSQGRATKFGERKMELAGIINGR